MDTPVKLITFNDLRKYTDCVKDINDFTNYYTKSEVYTQNEIDTIVADYQPKDMDTPIVIDGVQYDDIEQAVDAINTKLEDAQPKDLSTPIVIDGTSYTDIEQILNVLNNYTTNVSVSIAQNFSDLNSYSVGDLVIYENVLYKCTVPHNAGPWDSSHFTSTSIENEFMEKGKDYVTAGNTSNSTIGANATVEGSGNTAIGQNAHAEGAGTHANAVTAHSEGTSTNATERQSHAEGLSTTASGIDSHAENEGTTASNRATHAEGYYTTASHSSSHSEGYYTKTGNSNQHVQGKYNLGKADTAFEIGNGTSNNARSNALEIDWSGNVTASGEITDGNGNVLSNKINSSDIGAANGVASLDSAGKVPSTQLPSYVDDVLEYASISVFPETGESGKIYVALDTNKTYRWGGTDYVEISDSLAIGETATTAFAGNRGKAIEDKIPSNASASNKFATIADIPIISYPVSSVNSKTGAVILTASDIGAISTSDKGIANGVATLGSDGKIPSSQIPSTSTGSTIHKAEFNMNLYSSSESGVKEMILALGDFLGEIEYSFNPSTHKYLSRKAQIMHIELSEYMYNYNNHNNSSVYWYQPYNTSYIPYVSEANYSLTYGKYIYDVPTGNALGSNYSTYTFTMPMEDFGSNQFAYPLRVRLNLPGIRVRNSSGAVYDTVINYIYNSVNFIEFRNYMCYNGSNYTNQTTGNYIKYNDFATNSPWQTITVYYFDI